MSKEITIEIPFGDGKNPNANGRIYTQESIDKAFESLKSGKIFLTNPMTQFDPKVGIDLTQVRGVVVDAEKDGTRIKAKIEISDDIMAEFIEAGHFDVVPNGLGHVNPDTSVVEDYKLFNVSLTVDSAFKSKEPTEKE